MTEVEENEMSQSRFRHWTFSLHNEININSINYWANKTYSVGNINRIYHLRNGYRIKKENVWLVGWGRLGSASVSQWVPSIRTCDVWPAWKDCQSVANHFTGVLTQPKHHAKNFAAMGYNLFVVNTVMAGSPMIPSGIGNVPSMFTMAVSNFCQLCRNFSWVD